MERLKITATVIPLMSFQIDVLTSKPEVDLTNEKISVVVRATETSHLVSQWNFSSHLWTRGYAPPGCYRFTVCFLGPSQYVNY